jgi:pimeloyl-ACP methyl ester carboxylesterase
MGVPIVLGYCLEYSQQVAGLVCLSGLADLIRHSHAPTQLLIDVAEKPAVRLELMDRMIFSERQKKEQLAEVLELKLEAVKQRAQGLLANINGERTADFGVGSRLVEVKAPTIVIVGAADMADPPIVSKLIHDRIANSHMYVCDSAGHYRGGNRMRLDGKVAVVLALARESDAQLR